MLLYIESLIQDHPRAQAIMGKFPRAQIVIMDNYKNIFDAKHGSLKHQPSMIVAGAPSNPILAAPDGYGFEGNGLFFKTSLGCIYDCEYCYLKGMFRSDIPVYFVDYEYIWDRLVEAVDHLKNLQPKKPIWLYSSDYSDIQGMDVFSGFNDFFLPRVATLENVMMEIRTKSPSISSLLSRDPVHNVEIAYSLNPQEIITTYEKWTASLEKRIENITALLDAGWKVGIRIMPLMPVDGFENIYIQFIQNLSAKVDIHSLHSVFIGGLMYTHDDFRRMQKRGHLGDMLDKVDDSGQDFVRLGQVYRAVFYKLFRAHFPTSCEVCLDKAITI